MGVVHIIGLVVVVQKEEINKTIETTVKRNDFEVSSLRISFGNYLITTVRAKRQIIQSLLNVNRIKVGISNSNVR